MKKLIAVFFLASCASGSSAWNQTKAELETKWDANLVAPTCPAVNHEGQCGLLTDNDSWLRQTLQQTFSNYCQPRALSVADCNQSWNDSIIAKIKMRYRFAKQAKVDLECQSKPGSCDNLPGIELIYWSNHNHNVIELSRLELREAVATYEAASAQQASDNLKRLSASQAPPRAVHCVSERDSFSGKMVTDCR